MTKRLKTKVPEKRTSTTGSAAPASAAIERPEGKASVNDDRVVLQVRMRPALRREIKRSADEAEVTCQTFVLMALRAQGVGVTDADLLDLRKGGNRPLRAGSRSRDAGEALGDTDRNAVPGALLKAGVGGSGSGITVVINNYPPRPDP